RVNELWLEVIGRDYIMVNRQTRILYNGKLFQYPLEAFDALAKLGVVEATRCLGSYASQLFSPARQNGSFENWVCRRFGMRLFEIFFKTYSEKLWGISCSELDADFAAQRIKKFSLSAAVKSALLPGNRKQHHTLVDEFAYPVGGTGMVYERMAEAVRERGGKIHLNTPVARVLLKNNRAIGVELASGEMRFCDHIISTMPLTVLARQLDGVPAEIVNACNQLQFRNTILVYLEVLNENPFPDNWIYIHSPELRMGRVTNFRNWAPQLYGGSPHAILALEYWCDAGDEFWRRDEELLAAVAKEEIVKSGLVKHPEKLGRRFVFRIPKCYPVYRRGYQEPLRRIREFLDTLSGLQVIGRYGSFKYNNQDHSILMGRLAAENVLAGARHDLWGVNTDYETYQEACSITETGLVGAGAYAR
ncbi:MAG TPA: FAD-dependent oxidoreductase, partial [Verrucomicrobiae bacterium]|nr:FAD-dependent oxidoreductase [Verrucomicrobiae bacterium]